MRFYDRALLSALYRLYSLWLVIMQIKARMFAARNTPLLLHFYEVIGKSGASGSDKQPYKGDHLWRTLLRFKPKCIVEMGSGTTSAVFALYAKKYAASFMAFEHSERWGEATNSALRAAELAGGESPVKIVESYVAKDGSGSAVAEPIPGDTDFLYIDGPPCPVIDGAKRPNLDVVQLFERGKYPKAIVVDGRHETVDLIKNHPGGGRYRFEYDFGYSVKNRLWAHALRFRRHTIVYRNAN